MSPEALKAAHARLRAGVSRLREALSEPAQAEGALDAAARAVLPELFQHVTDPDADRRCEPEHLSLRSLARDFQVVVENPQLYPYAHRARLAAALADAVTAHLDFETAFLLR